MQYTITNSDWTQISQAGESCSFWLDQQNDGAIGSMDVRFLVSTSKPSDDDFTKARRIYKPKDNSDTILVNAMF